MFFMAKIIKCYGAHVLTIELEIKPPDRQKFGLKAAELISQNRPGLVKVSPNLRMRL